MIADRSDLPMPTELGPRDPGRDRSEVVADSEAVEAAARQARLPETQARLPETVATRLEGLDRAGRPAASAAEAGAELGRAEPDRGQPARSESSRFGPGPRGPGLGRPGAGPGPGGPVPISAEHDGTPRNGADRNGVARNGADHGGATAPQLRRFIKSRAYVPMHELRRRFAIDGDDDDVTAVEVERQRVYVGLPPREGRLLAELLQGGDIGVELSLDPIAPIVVGVYPMRPVPRT